MAKEAMWCSSRACMSTSCQNHVWVSQKHQQATETECVAVPQVNMSHDDVDPRQCVAEGWCQLWCTLPRVEHETPPSPHGQQILLKRPELHEDETLVAETQHALKLEAVW